MDKRQLIASISLSVAVFALWIVFEQWYVKTHPQLASPPDVVNTIPAAPTVPSSPSTMASAPALPAVPATQAQLAAEASTVPSTLPTTLPAGISAPLATSQLTSAPTAPHAVPAVISSPVILGSEAKNDPTYAMEVSLQAEGAGIAEVTLNDFPSPDAEHRKKGSFSPYRFQSVLPEHPLTSPLATRSLVIGDAVVDLSQVAWTRVASTPSSATYSVQIVDAVGPLLELTKTFTLPKRAETAQTSKGFEIGVEQTIKSLRPGATIHVRAIINGPNPAPAEQQDGIDLSVVAGYDQNGRTIGITPTIAGTFRKTQSKDLTQNDEKQHFAWAGQYSAYFAALLLPDPAQQSLFTVHADAIELPTDAPPVVALTFETPDIQILDKPTSLSMTFFAGPKWREVLDTDYYRAFPRRYFDLLVLRNGFCGTWCTFPWLINGLVWILWLFHSIFRDWGLSIICLVLVVRALLHPITKKSQMQMMKMGKLGPEVEKLKAKYKDEPDVLNKEMMGLYKEQGGAFLGCLPMFLQTPIWIALWSSLQSTFELRQAPFLYGLTWIHDLAKPDRLIDIAAIIGHPIPLVFGFKLSALNILPLAMAVVTYINMKYFTPTPPAATPEQESQQKMSRNMSLIFPLMFYSLPSGLNIYYLTSMSLGIVEGKIIRKHIKDQEEAEKAGRVFVPAKATRAAKRRDENDSNSSGKGQSKTPAPTGLFGKMAARFSAALLEAQKQAEDIRKEQKKKDPKNGR